MSAYGNTMAPPWWNAGRGRAGRLLGGLPAPRRRRPVLLAAMSTVPAEPSRLGSAPRPRRGPGRQLRPVATPTLTPAAPPPDRPVEADHVEVWRLVEAAKAGDGEAFGQLYDRYADVVYRYVYYRVTDRGLAEDLTSETFLRALRRISAVTYQGRDIGAWLVTIARNLVLDHVKSARSRLESTTDDISLLGDRARSAERPATPEAMVLDAITSQRLMTAVQALGAEQRECVLLRFVQGFSVSETAEIMGKKDGAIKALQHRAVRKLAATVGEDL